MDTEEFVDVYNPYRLRRHTGIGVYAATSIGQTTLNYHVNVRLLGVATLTGTVIGVVFLWFNRVSVCVQAYMPAKIQHRLHWTKSLFNLAMPNFKGGHLNVMWVHAASDGGPTADIRYVVVANSAMVLTKQLGPSRILW